jgi:hypothetical protein
MTSYTIRVEITLFSQIFTGRELNMGCDSTEHRGQRLKHLAIGEGEGRGFIFWTVLEA